MKKEEEKKKKEKKKKEGEKIISEKVQALLDNFTLEAWIVWLKESPQRHIQIIANYAEEILPDVRTYDQGQVFIGRNVRPARELMPFSDEQIANAMKKVYSEEYITKWGLETLLKYIF